MKKYINTPASGEQRAVSGFEFQYEVSAYLILKSLKQKKLKWVKFIDPQAGRMDDFQINISGTISAYQIKKSSSENYISFNQVVSSSQDYSIINQLADGWKQLKNNHEEDIKVCFLTNMSPSKNDRLCEQGDRRRKSFKNFIDSQWSNRASFLITNANEEWKPVWQKIQDESKLSNKDFQEFIRGCELIFSFKLPSEEYSSFPEDFKVFYNDIDRLKSFISKSVSQAEHLPLKFTAQQLLQKLDWQRRVEYRNIHRFPIDKAYETIQTTKDNLLESIKEIESGYIILQGSPGSGKSSLLEKELIDTDKIKTIKYFSYIPDDRGFSSSRGESINFFHDISKSLENIGYEVGDSLNLLDLSFLQKRLINQFQKIETAFNKSGKKLVIIVDGLDHIEREMSPTRSFLSDLPLPESLPKGIIFLISSQMDQLQMLPPKIEEQIRMENRKIVIEKLSKQSVLSMIDKSDLKISLDGKQKNIIFEKSEGHPLALKLILKQTSLCDNNRSLNSILQNIDKYHKSIETAYYSHWKKIRENTKLTRLLGLVSRLTEGINWHWVSQWQDQDQDTIELFKKEFWYYFDEENEKWYFFHNSFRIFIERKTIEKPHGDLDWNKDKKFHKYLAEKVKDTPDKFGEIFHFYKAEEYKKIIEISTQNYFKKQIDVFCPPSNVLEDIKFSISAAGKQNNLNHIFKLTLSGATINLIESYLFAEIDKLINLLLSLDKYGLAKAYIRKRRTLLISKEKAMSLIKSFLYFGYDKEAKVLFELSEPLDFFHIEQSDLFEKIEVLKEWASNAPYFYNINRIRSMISSLKIKNKHPFHDAENNLKAELLYNTGKTLIYKDDLKSLEIVFIHLKNLNQGYYFYLLLDYCNFLIKRKNDKKEAEKYFKKVEELRIKNNDFSLLFAETCFFSFENKKQAKRIIKKIKYPEDHVKSTRHDDISPYIYRFKLIRLMKALHIPFSLESLIPEPKEEREHGLFILERNFVKLGVLWGNFLSGHRISPETLKNEILPFIRFYNINFFSRTNWTDTYRISQSKDTFFRILISFVKSTYPKELANIFKLFKSQWDKEENKQYWNNEIKFKIISNFFNAGCLKSELNDELKILQKNKIDNMNIIIKDRFDYANLLVKFNKKEEAEVVLKELIQKSINIGWRKDYQLITWLDWLALFNEENPEGAKKRIEQFIRYVQIAETTTERSESNIAFGKLIHISAEISSSYALALSKWLLDNDCISFSSYIDDLTSAFLKTGHISIDEGSATIKHILLPVSNARDISSLESVVKKLQGASKNEIKEKTLSLIEYINCHSVPSNQNNLRRDVIFTLDKINFNWLKLGMKWNDVKDTYSSSDSYELKINEETVNFFELTNKIKSISDILKFKRASSNSFYKWSKLIERKKHLISLDDLPILEKEFKQTSDWNNILYILSNHLYEVGEKEVSLKLAKELLKNSRPYEWTWFFGDTRIKAFKSLKNHIQPEHFKSKLVDTLTKDLQNLDDSYLFISKVFDQIFKLIYEKMPIEIVWPFVDEFLKRLFSSYNETDFPLPDINETKSNLPVIFQILLPLLLHPVNLISQGAYSAIYNLLHKINDCSLIENIINSSNEEQQILLLNILKGIIFYDSSKQYLITEKFLKQISSNNFYIRALVQDLLKELNHSYHPVYIKKKSKPSSNLLYELILPDPKPSRLYGTEQYDPYRALPDTNNPLEIVKLYKNHINILSELSGVPLINLATKTVQIMDKLSDGNYGYEADKKLRSTLSSQYLEMPFRRPRGQIARQAICHLISELLDLNKINEKFALMIMNDLSYIDPLLTCIKWFPKPDLIQYDFPQYTVSDEWINDETIKENELIVGKTIESMVVVGEIRYVKSMDSSPSEEIQSVLSFSKQPIQLNRKCLYKDYFKISDKPEVLYLNEGFTFDTEKSNWLAIHPSIMKKYGMTLSKYNPFVWLSNKKEVMSKIIYWKNGSVEHSSHIGQCGNGVFCLLDKSLLDKILLENTVYLKTKRTRIYLKDNKEKSVTLYKPFYSG